MDTRKKRINQVLGIVLSVALTAVGLVGALGLGALTARAGSRLITITKPTIEEDPGNNEGGTIVTDENGVTTFTWGSGEGMNASNPILSEKVGDFEWEFTYLSPADISWTTHKFMFHAQAGGSSESNTYAVLIQGNGFGKPHVVLGKNNDYSLGSYTIPDGIGWQQSYRVKMTLAGQSFTLKIWPVETTEPAEAAITATLAEDEALATGYFKAMHYGNGMVLSDMIIRANGNTYCTNKASLPPESSEVSVPESSETSAPESSEVSAPESSEASAPESSEVSAPESSEVSAPESSEVSAPESSEVSAPESSEVSTPESSEVSTPESSEVSAPESSEPKQTIFYAPFEKSADGNANGTITTVKNRIFFKYVGSDGMLATNRLLGGKAVGDFEWEFDYQNSEINWNTDKFMFRTQLDGASENETYCLYIRGNGNEGPQVILAKNADYGNPIATYTIPDGLTSSVYHIRMTMAGSKFSFYMNEKGKASGKPALTATLNDAELAAGDFKVMVYGGGLSVYNSVIRADGNTYYAIKSEYEKALNSAGSKPSDPSDAENPSTGVPTTAGAAAVLLLASAAVLTVGKKRKTRA